MSVTRVGGALKHLLDGDVLSGDVELGHVDLGSHALLYVGSVVLLYGGSRGVSIDRMDEQTRRRLSVEDRRSELVAACLRLIGTRPWDDVTMADVAAEANASKPLVYHYFATKAELYLATVEAAADELRDVTRPDPVLPVGPAMRGALDRHLDWIDANALAYRAIVQGGISSDANVAAIIEQSRDETVERLAAAFGLTASEPAHRLALRGWVGFLEAACLEWLDTRTLTRDEVATLLEASVVGALGAARAVVPSRAPVVP